MNKLKSLTAAALITASAVTSAAIPAFAAKDIKVTLDGEAITFDTAPEIVSDRTFVPLRAIAENLGLMVEWEEQSQKITMRGGDTNISLIIGSTKVGTSGTDFKITEIEAAPYIKDGRTMVPIRFVSESFGLNVDWDSASSTVVLEKSMPILPKNIPYYEKSPTVPDFGAIFGMENELTDSAYYYHDTIEEQRTGYLKILQNEGFKLVDRMNVEGADSYGYMKDDMTVVVTLFNIPGMENVYSVFTAPKVESFNGDITFYKDFPNVPDFECLGNSKFAEKQILGNNEIFAYSYEVKQEDINILLIQYSQLLSNNSFTLLKEDLMLQTYYNISDNTFVSLSYDIVNGTPIITVFIQPNNQYGLL